MERPVAVANWKTTRAKPCALRITSIDSTFARNHGSGNSWHSGLPKITTTSSGLGVTLAIAVANCLTRRGISTLTGRTNWHPTQVRNILRST